MKKMMIAAAVLSTLLMANVQAADNMSHDGMTKEKAGMSHDSMAKDNMGNPHSNMCKDGMCKEGMKKDEMKKDEMKKDSMGKMDNMGKDKKESMSK
ncbi:hypothetical protein J8655_17695 [Dickeya oryzae]|uniref:hypothetical protein n=1 Tax=Dickeya oryzae TaxID=1240404 RepID=UPI001AECBC6C|nr:hypothetical protein [Dickeya oryzae]MBP2847286.1 hypothetical protein [Dickeya oryzae]